MSEDVVELILADHRRFEELLDELRDTNLGRESSRAELAALLVAHAEAAQAEVYPRLRKRAGDSVELAHRQPEHAEINEALLALLDVSELDNAVFDRKLAELTEVVDRHIDTVEQTLLGETYQEIGATERMSLGIGFTTVRKVALDTDCGRPENVRLLVDKAKARVE